MRTHTATAIAILAGLTLVAQPQLVATRFPTPDLVVADAVFSTATTAADSDCAPALQAAIDELAARGGGTLFLPAAQYAINSPLVVKEGVVLRGDNAAPATHDFGTLFAIRHAPGDADATPTFGLQRGSGLRELAFWYPEQDLDQPRPYPWTIATTAAQSGNNQSIINCTLVNPYRAIKIGDHFNELHTIRNVRLCPLHTGIEIDSVTDIGRLDDLLIDLTVWTDSGLPGAPPTPTADTPPPLARLGALGIDLGRSDWEYIYNVRIRGLASGMRFRKGLRGSSNAVMAYTRIEDCDTALELRELNGVGLSCYQSVFSGREQAVLATEAFTTVAQFHSCQFASLDASRNGAIQLNGTGTLSCQNCLLNSGSCQAEAGQLVMVNCDAHSATPIVTLGKAVLRARILGGSLAEKCHLTRHAPDADIIHAPIPAALQPSVLPPLCPPEPDAATPFPPDTALVLVTDFGASPALPDNGPAFQQALNHAASLDRPAIVYVPAGLYAFRTNLLIPSRVELRGSFAVPHHTVSAGTVLMPYHGQNDENGAPFLSLQPHSGLRGFSCWYPEQRSNAPVPYPWTVRILGPQCRLADLTIGNAWQAVDAASHPNTGLDVNYLAGAMFRRGIVIAHADHARIRDMQFNPHYANRLHASLPRPENTTRDGIMATIDFQRANLEGIVIRDSRDLLLRGNFLYAAKDGIAFQGHCQADVLMQGVDTAWHAAVLASDSAATSLRFALAQLVPLGNQNIAAIVSRPDFAGKAIFLNSQFWAGNNTAVLDGPGRVHLEQFNSLTGPVIVNRGHCSLSTALFNNSAKGGVIASGEQQSLSLLTPLSARGAFPYDVPASSPLRVFAMSNQLPPRLPEAILALPTAFTTDCESPTQPPFSADTIAIPGGGSRDCSGVSCQIVARDDAHSGTHAILLQGNADNRDYAFAYCEIYAGPFAVMPDSVLSYWIMPLNPRGLTSGIDIRFSNGMVMRDMGIQDKFGRRMHVSTPKGPENQWTQVVIPLGQSSACGLVIDKIMLAYDARQTSGPFAVLVDDLALTATLPAACWQISISPASGTYPHPTTVTIVNPSSLPIHYTLDGSNPNATSPHYDGPLTLPTGNTEFRFACISPDSAAPAVVNARFYSITP